VQFVQQFWKQRWITDGGTFLALLNFKVTVMFFFHESINCLDYGVSFVDE